MNKLGTYKSGARVRFERCWKNVCCIYQHSGIVLVEVKADGQPYVLNPFKEVVTRSEYSSMFFNFDADVETNENRVLIEKKMDFM